MDENLPVYSSSKKEVKASGVLIISALILAIIILTIAGYFLYRDYQKRYSNKSNVGLIKESSILQPQFDTEKKQPIDNKNTYAPNLVKIGELNDLIKKFEGNRNLLSEFAVSYNIQANINKINQENPNLTVLSLIDEQGNTIDIELSKEETGKAQVYSESPGVIQEKSFFDLKHGDNIEIRVILDLLSENPTIYRIRVY